MSTPSYSLVAKFAKERYTLDGLSPATTIGEVKDAIAERTHILPKRQKLVGLVVAKRDGLSSTALTDDTMLSDLKVKKSTSSSKGKTNDAGGSKNVIVHEFILMGTKEEDVFVDPSEKDELPDVVDDFELDFSAGSDEWTQHVANGENLKKFTERTQVHIMNPPREGKPLLVLDLDRTLLHFSRQIIEQNAGAAGSTSNVANAMKRPYMDQFLTECYIHYDLVVWSQTSWRWLETKLIELGMLSNPGYKFCFVLDKTSMFTVISTRRSGTSVTHHVKPLQLIWSKFPGRWSSKNTAHVDDLGRNFALNLGSGIKVAAYDRKKSKARRDVELLALARYLDMLAKSRLDFESVDFNSWKDVVAGTKKLADGTNSGSKK